MIDIRQGEDYILEVPVYNKNNAKVSLTGVTKLRVSINVKNEVNKKYMDDTIETLLPGYGIVNIKSTDDTIIQVYITREQSKLFASGFYNLSILYEFPDVALDGIAVEYETAIIGNILKGNLINE